MKHILIFVIVLFTSCTRPEQVYLLTSHDGSFQVEPALTLQRLIGGANAEKRAVHLKELFKAIERDTADMKRLTKDIGDAEIDPLNVGIVTEAVKSYIKHTFFKNFVFSSILELKGFVEIPIDCLTFSQPVNNKNKQIQTITIVEPK